MKRYDNMSCNGKRIFYLFRRSIFVLEIANAFIIFEEIEPTIMGEESN